MFYAIIGRIRSILLSIFSRRKSSTDTSEWAELNALSFRVDWYAPADIKSQLDAPTRTSVLNKD
jgi:hypothetical protein